MFFLFDDNIKGAGDDIAHPLTSSSLGTLFVCLCVDLCLFGCLVSEGMGVVSHPEGKLNKLNGQTRLCEQF